MVTLATTVYPAAAMSVRRPVYNSVAPPTGSFGAFVRAWRADRLGLTQEAFAALVADGMTATDVSQLERGKVELPKPPRMIALARAFGLPVVELYAAAGYPEFMEIEPITDAERDAVRARLQADGIDVA